MSDPSDPHERARRLARLIVSDIIIYNQDKVVEGIKEDTLFDLLKEDIEVGRTYYEKNIDPAVAEQANYFNQALVDILIKGRGNIPSKIW
ncbi:MAG: hypothetical protein ACREJ6_08800 [Candidatus Methylomirabilis sp.]